MDKPTWTLTCIECNEQIDPTTPTAPCRCVMPQDAPSVDSDGVAPQGGAVGEPVLERARADFLEISRNQERIGIAEYGESLTTGNGHDPIQDAAEELVDAFHYLTQARMERSALEQSLADRGQLHAALRRWIDADEAFQEAEPGSWRQHEIWMEACEATVDLKTVARAALARGGGGGW